MSWQFPEKYESYTPIQKTLYCKMFNIDEKGIHQPEISGQKNDANEAWQACKTGSEKKQMFLIARKYGVFVGPSEFDKYPLD